MTTTIALRPMLPADLPTLAAIAQAAIEELAAEDYGDSQRAAWIDALDETLMDRATAALTLVATVGGTPVGFASLRDSKHIDLLYVDPQAARQGVATALCDALEKLAAARGASELTVEASDTAKPLFDARGYTGLRRNTVTLGDEWLANTTMQKKLAPN